MSMYATSDNLRREGNDLYSEGMNDYRPKAKQTNFQQALHKYNAALARASNHSERSSALKNIGLTSWRLAQVTPTVVCTVEPKKTTAHFYEEALKNLDSACTERSRMPPSMALDQWLDDVRNHQLVIMTSFISWCEENLSLVDRRLPLYRALSNVSAEAPLVRCPANLALLETEFKLAINVEDKQDYRLALKHLHECPYHIEELLRYGTANEKHEAQVYKKDVVNQQNTIQAIQSIDLADEQLEATVFEEESLNMDGVYLALDSYHYALTLAQGYSIENECKALSRIGRMYVDVMGMPSQASIFFKRCIEMALTMYPRVLHNKDWYVYAETRLQAYQQELSRNDAQEDARKKAAIRAQLKDELKKLEEIAKIKTLEEFRDALYAAFPPKRDAGKIKKVGPALLMCYSPDKQEEEEHGEKWLVLCEEITKVLNSREDVLAK